MLQTIRERTQGWIAGSIITLIILTFALWGIHSYFVGGTTDSVIAEVNGTTITREQLTTAYERLRRQIQYDSHTVMTLHDEAALKNQALQALIEMEVLKQASLAQGFQIFDRQVDSYLQSIPAFQVKGQFSEERFHEMLSSTLLSTSEFLDLVKTSLLIDQPKLGVVTSSFALPEETSYTIALINQTRDIDYMQIPLAYFLSQPIVISPAKLHAYYEQHQQDFMTPEKVSIEYLELSLKALATQIHPTDSGLQHFYNENINSYTDPHLKEPKIQPFHVVKDSVKKAYIRQQAEEKFARLKEQLADLTYEHPDALQTAATTLKLPIKTSDFFSKDKAGKENDLSNYQKIREVAFSNDVLQLQNNSDVIQLNPETVVVLRIKSRLQATALPFKTVEKQIEQKLKLAAAESRAIKFVETLKAKLVAGESPLKLAKSMNLSWINAGSIGRYSKTVDPAILDVAFSLPHPTPSLPHPTPANKMTFGTTRLPNGYAIVALKSVKEGKANKKQDAVFAEQIQANQGLLEYELYKQSQMNQAHVTPQLK